MRVAGHGRQYTFCSIIRSIYLSSLRAPACRFIGDFRWRAEACLMGGVATLTTRGSPDSRAVDELEIELVCERDLEGVVPGIDVANRVASEFAR